MTRPWLDHAREVEWLTINDTKNARNPRPDIKTYRITADLVYSLLGSISRPLSSTFLTKSKVDRTDAAVNVSIE